MSYLAKQWLFFLLIQFSGRDAVLLKTVYKSPSTIHVFSFSADEPHLFPNVPPLDTNIIRTQVDLQGWSIEALSPTTTLITLLEQSDPKGWTGKTSIPNQMISTLAGIGEFAIKCGGPPTVTRLAGAKANEIRYDHEKASFRVEYEASASRRTNTNGDDNDQHLPAIELELRCDLDTWAASLDIIVDPPPQTISCLRRHKLSAQGGGLWLTLAHDVLFVDDERLLTIVRKAPGKEKGLVIVNGAKVHVDVEEIADSEIKALTKQKRVKPVRIPLDQPPVMSNINRKKAEWGDNGNRHLTSVDGTDESGEATKPVTNSANTWASAPKNSSPLARFITYYVDQATTTTQQAVAAIAPINVSGDNALPSSSKLPLQHALEALSWAQDTNPNVSNNDWTLVSERGLLVHRKIVPEISPIIPVHRGSKVIEGLSADELVPTITHWDCRRKWDNRFDSAQVFESYGANGQTVFLVSKAGFPFRDRGFYIANVVVRGALSGSSSSLSNSLAVSMAISRQSSTEGNMNGTLSSGSGGGGAASGDHSSSSARRTIYCVSASFSADSVASFAPAKYNPHTLPIGRVYVDAWVLETLDPYTKENYMIPSTHVTRYIAVDYAGSIPAAVNSMINASIPRCILALETFVKGSVGSVAAPIPVLRLPASSLVMGMVGRKEEEMFAGMKASAWRLKKRDESRGVVWEKFEVEEKKLGVCLQVKLPASAVKAKMVAVRSASVSGLGPGRTGITDQRIDPDGDEEGDGEQAITPRPSRTTLRSRHSGTGHERGESMIINPNFTPLSTLNSTPAANLSNPSLSQIRTSPSRQRQRTVSSAAALSHIVATVSAFDGQRRGRSATGFLIKDVGGATRWPGNLVVAEIVVDKKMYTEGYEVKVWSRMRKDVRVGQKGGFVSLKEKNMSADANVLPLQCAIYAMPLSPMHSSGESGTRHLVRIVLPTSQIEREVIKDPLTGGGGEVRGGGHVRDTNETGETRPQWWIDLAEGGEAVVWIEVLPSVGVNSSSSTYANPVNSIKGKKGKKDSGKREVVIVDGKEIGVVDEKEGLTSLGRDELMDDRVGKMNVISRCVFLFRFF